MTVIFAIENHLSLTKCSPLFSVASSASEAKGKIFCVYYFPKHPEVVKLNSRISKGATEALKCLLTI